LDDKGRPCPTERVFVLPPASQIGPLTAAQRNDLMTQSIVAGVYEKTVDRASAYEELKGRSAAPQQRASGPPRSEPAAQAPPERGMLDEIGDLLGGGHGRRRASLGEQLMKSAASSIGREVGRQIIRGVLGSILGGGRR
jgi:hypothetical protein